MDKLQFLLLVIALLAYTAAVLISYVNPAGIPGIFYSDAADIDKKYFQQVTPQPYAFGIIWPTIYFLNLLGILYISLSPCLPEWLSPFKARPTLIPKEFLVCYILTYSSMTLWLFAFDRELLELSLVLIAFSVVAVYSCIAISYKVVYNNSEMLEKSGKAMLWLVRILIQNSLCTLATWLTIATLLNFADVLIYKSSFGVSPAVLRGIVSMVDGSTITLVLLMVAIVTWFYLENFVLEKYCRYTFTVYPVLIFASATLVDKLRNLPDADQNLLIAKLILGLAVIALVARIGLYVVKSNERAKAKAE